MPCKLRKSSLKNIFNGFLIGTLVFAWASVATAFPDTERVPADPSTLTEPPLNLFNDQPTDFVITSDGRYIFFAFGDEIERVDLFSWELTDDQVPDLNDTSSDADTADEAGEFEGLAIRGSRLYATQDDGDLVIIDLDDITDDEPDVVKISDGELGLIVADPDSSSTDDQLYIADVHNKQVHVFDISDNEVTIEGIPLTSGGGNLEPGDLEFAALDDQNDKLFVATDGGVLFVITEGGTSATAIDIDSANENDLVSLAVSPNQELLFVLDDTAKEIHIFTTSDNNAVLLSDVPIDMSTANGDLWDITITTVEDTDDVYAFIGGSEGVSIIDLDIASDTLADFLFVDMGTDGDDNDEPFELAGGRIANRIFAPLDNYILTVNTDTTLSVITENPFVTITANSLTGTLGAGGDFTLTFEADVAGTYSVRVGGDLDSLGTEVDSGTVPTANTAVTTSTIDYDSNSSVFDEGENEIFVLVTDGSDGDLRGHDMEAITVDTPPPQVTLDSTGFGNGRAYLDFERLDVSDVETYNLYAETTSTAVLDAAAAIRATVSQPASSTAIVEGVIPSLTNGQTYFLAVEAVDANDNVGPRNGTLPNGSLAVATPQVTVGLSGASGETGCQLIQNAAQKSSSVWSLAVAFLLLVLGRVLLGLVSKVPGPGVASMGRMPPRPSVRGGMGPIGDRTPWVALLGLILFIILFFNPGLAFAKEASPQWWTFEFKVGELIPIDDTTDSFLTTCCNERFEMEFGFLYDSKYGFEIGVGFLNEGRRAIGSVSGGASQDRFNFTLIPIQNNITFRADFKENQLFVPYVKFGPDYWIFRENLQGDVTSGVKFGLHGTAGVQILLEFGDEGTAMELNWGVNDVYLTLEGEYAYVNGFGGTGLDLSGWLISAGILFEF